MTRQYIDDYLTENRIQPKDYIEISSMDLLIDFARIGVGVACVIKSFVQDDLASGALVEIPLGIPIHKRELVSPTAPTANLPNRSMSSFSSIRIFKGNSPLFANKQRRVFLL